MRGLRLEPGVRADAQIVVRGHGLDQRDDEVHVLRLLRVFLLQHPVLVVQDLLAVAVLDQQVESLGPPVHRLVVHEVRRQRQLH